MRFTLNWMDRHTMRRLLVLFGLLMLFGLGVYRAMIWMPGQSYRGELPPLTPAVEQLAAELRTEVEAIASRPHNYIAYPELVQVAQYLETTLAQTGYPVEVQEYSVADQSFQNLILEIPGRTKPDEIVVVGAHYDSVVGVPGANDNGSGVAAILAIARRMATQGSDRTLRLVAFTNEEPPFFWTDDMGSLVYAKRCKARQDKIVAMLSLETLGYYDDAPGSQTYPIGLLDRIYPIQGNFISFVGNIASAALVRRVVGTFRAVAQFPSEAAILPNAVAGAGWSDHWSFWQQGYPALMVTDTAPFRYPHYHTLDDTPDKLDYDRFARVVTGLEAVIQTLING
jgi:Zn-dependent M28 family amino/carboxypeptidase